VVERLNPHRRLRRECGTLKIKSVGSGGVEGSASGASYKLGGGKAYLVASGSILEMVSA